MSGMRTLALITAIMAVLLLMSTPSMALLPPDPPSPGGDPPGSPPPDYPGASPGNESVVLPVPEDIVYDAVHAEPSDYLSVWETDPDTGLPVENHYGSDELLVTFTPETTDEEIDQILAGIDGWKKEYVAWVNYYTVGFAPVSAIGELQDKIATLLACPNVVSVERSPLMQSAACPDEWYYGYCNIEDGQWNLKRIGMPAAWDIQQGKGDYATVGVVDSGVDKSHPDLQTNLRSESDEHHGQAHGTCCTGIVGAVTNNGLGVAGLGWNVRMISKWAYTAMHWSWIQDYFYTKRVHNRIGDILRYQTAGGVVSISMSFGSTADPEHFMKSAINNAFERGVLSMAAVGNGNKRTENQRPAIYCRVMGVGASDRYYTPGGAEARVVPHDWTTWGSNWGPCLSVLAPGTQIPTTDVDGGYTLGFCGTSAATPTVAGLAALVRSEFQSMGPLDIRHRIEDTASDNVARDLNSSPIAGWDEYTGWGVIRADQALTSDGTFSITIPGNAWNVVNLPVWPKEALTGWQTSAFPQNVFPAGQRSLLVYKPGSDDYYSGTQYDSGGFPLIGLVKPYRAFWVKYDSVSSVTVTAQGAKAGIKAGHWLEFPLNRGWNLIGDPFLGADLPLSNSNIKFRIGENADYQSLTEARSNHWIGKICRWDVPAQQWVEVVPNSGHVMQPGQGYAVYCNGSFPFFFYDVYMMVKR